MNKVILVGRLCTDPELKYTPSGVAVANFRIAVDRSYKNAQGERVTDFIDIVAWRQQAEFVNTYVTKGRLVLIDGSLQVRQWQTPDGQPRRNTEVVAENIRALDRPREPREGGGMDSGEMTPPPERPRQTTSARAAAPQAPARRDDFAPQDDLPDYDPSDITDPFADQ